LPAAFSESPPIRNAYIRAYIQHAYHGATHVAVNEFLRGQKALLQYIKDSFSPALFPDLDSMAIMLPAVERRLGLCTGPYLFYYFICSECWAPYHIEELATLDSPKCTAKLCSGQLYSMKTLGSGDQKRFDHMQHWRQDGDEPGAIPPIEEAEHYKSHSVDAKMHDIHDGWGWRAIEAWVTRTYDSKGHVIEGTRKKHRQRFVALPCGLVFIFSIDWFQNATWKQYSLGAVYLTICNLPRSIWYLMEETILYMVIPGPSEPSQNQLNSLLDL
ncbi:uncharacterized protein EI90DRAFT_2874972, partial [Cantharellus anzutake]|uniref:uncharacterized protein n=1 Tax=Cantharellus anzutake TaxID=1750568 RepID=UPI001903157D